MKYVNELFDNLEFMENLKIKIGKYLQDYLLNPKNASKKLAEHLKSFI
jgi:hypothetical protein